MNKSYLNEIINENQNLLQDLNDNSYIKNEFLGVLRNIESIIPEDCRENFYTNLKTLRLEVTDTTKNSGTAVGFYSTDLNKICINKNMLDKMNNDEKFEDIALTTLYHELLHMASNTRDEKTRYFASGFQHIETNENGEYIFSEDLKGLSEGFTEKLTMLAFGRTNRETYSEYEKQMAYIDNLTELVDLETLKKAYFNNKSGMKLIDSKLEEIDGIPSHIELYLDIESDFMNRFDQTQDVPLLENIATTFAQLLYKKTSKSKNISPEKVEEATENVRSSLINDNTEAIKQNAKEKDETNIEKE